MRGVVVLGERGGAVATLRPISPAEGVSALVGNAIFAGADRLPATFGLVARLAGDVPVYRATVPDHLYAAPRAARDIFELLARLEPSN